MSPRDRAVDFNPVENVCQFVRTNWLSDRVFALYTAIVDTATPENRLTE